MLCPDHLSKQDLKRQNTSSRDAPLSHTANLEIDGDIISRIRALRLSTQLHCPPRTPCPSEEEIVREGSRRNGRVKALDLSSRDLTGKQKTLSPYTIPQGLSYFTDGPGREFSLSSLPKSLSTEQLSEEQNQEPTDGKRPDTIRSFGESKDHPDVVQPATSLGVKLKEVKPQIPVIVTAPSQPRISEGEVRGMELIECIESPNAAYAEEDCKVRDAKSDLQPVKQPIHFTTSADFPVECCATVDTRSLSSNRSKRSQRHNLLRSSVGYEDNIDLGLPAQPVLTTDETMFPSPTQDDVVSHTAMQNHQHHHYPTSVVKDSIQDRLVKATQSPEHSNNSSIVAKPQIWDEQKEKLNQKVCDRRADVSTEDLPMPGKFFPHSTIVDKAGIHGASVQKTQMRIDEEEDSPRDSRAFSCPLDGRALYSGTHDQPPFPEKLSYEKIVERETRLAEETMPSPVQMTDILGLFIPSQNSKSGNDTNPETHTVLRQSSLPVSNPMNNSQRARTESEPAKLTRLSITKIPSTDRYQMRTSRWLQDIFAGGTAQQSTHLTALPARATRAASILSSVVPKDAHFPCDVPDVDPRQSISVAFAKAINDLERLLEEALLVAKNATENHDGSKLPDLEANAAAVTRLRADTERVLSTELDRHSSDNASEFFDIASSVSCNSIHESLIGLVQSLSSIHNSLIGSDRSELRAQAHEEQDTADCRRSEREARGFERAFDIDICLSPLPHADSEKFYRQPYIGPPASLPGNPNGKISKAHQKTNNSKPPAQNKKSDSVCLGSTVTMASNAKSVERVCDPSKGLDNAVKLKKPSPLTKKSIFDYIKVFNRPPLPPRASSKLITKGQQLDQAIGITTGVNHIMSVIPHCSTGLTGISMDGPSESEVVFNSSPSPSKPTAEAPRTTSDQSLDGQKLHRRRHVHRSRRPVVDLSLKGRSHVSLRDAHHGFSLSRSHRRQPIARDWSTGRKRGIATVACISTALIGILIGIYAGQVPSIQYYIADMHHYAILGNVFLFVGLAIPSFFCWPLPLLHGRKPYILGALAAALPLLFPPAIVCSNLRSPLRPEYRVGLLLPRAFMGLALGFANMNFQSILLDLFGASLQSGNPHQEIVDPYDVRRHGGGMGVWLGIWTWAFIGSIGIGFTVGATIINYLPPSWGFYVSIIITAVILLLNIVCPEVRRSPYRRSIAEVRLDGKDVSRRLARGEVMMHRVQTGPRWWGEEMYHGILLNLDMLRQPGFLVVALYMGWIYGQVVLLVVLLGSLTSKYYMFKSPDVGACVLSLPLGVLLAVPFQKASLFSRARHHNVQRTNSMTFEKKVTWSSHLVRRLIFTLVLPFAGLAYTLSSGGPPTPWILPVLFAALFGFLSGLAISECNGIIMETFDTSDLQAGMTGRPRGMQGSYKRTNYSSFPRVASACSIVQSWGFLVAAAATGTGGVVQRHLGQQAATGVMAGILLVLTVLLLGVLVRWKEVQVIPNSKTGELERWKQKRRESIERQLANPMIDGDAEAEAVESWRPIVIGNPSGRTRNMSVLELGHLTRWSDIRKKNKLIDEMGYEGKHPNLATLDSVRVRLRQEKRDVTERMGSRRRKPKTQSDRLKEEELGVDSATEGTDEEILTREFSWEIAAKEKGPGKKDEEN